MITIGFNTGTLILGLIGLLSILGVGIIIERLLYFRRNQADEEKILARLRSSL